ncbi:AMP-binding protein [Nocardia aobensis]|uniref:AMP-binding protein n=1 Tax=Nocardia aobensis TaxID=257277 RepID=A0ABW6PFB5_9NOCA
MTERARSAAGKRVMLIGEDGERVTAVDAALRAEAMAARLYAEGVREGTRVAWQLPNTVDTALIVLALARLRAVQIPVKADVGTGEQILLRASAARPELILVPRSAAGRCAPGTRGAHHGLAHVLAVEPHMWSDGDRNMLPPYTPDDWSPRWLFTQSQSNGTAVTVQHTDVTLSIAARGMARSGRFDRLRTGVGAVMTPLAEPAGLIQFAALIASAMPALVMQASEPAHVVGVLRQFRVCLVFGPHNICRALLEKQRALPRGSKLVPQLRWFVTSGQAGAPDIAQQLKRELGIALAHDYGRCEVPLISVGNVVGTTTTPNGLVGAAIPGVSVRISKNGARARAGASGDIEVSVAGVFAGYTDPRHNNVAITHDGWFRTGDRGRLTSDNMLEVLHTADRSP